MSFSGNLTDLSLTNPKESVEQDTIFNGARGYTAHSGEGQKVVVMKKYQEKMRMSFTP